MILSNYELRIICNIMDNKYSPIKDKRAVWNTLKKIKASFTNMPIQPLSRPNADASEDEMKAYIKALEISNNNLEVWYDQDVKTNLNSVDCLIIKSSIRKHVMNVFNSNVYFEDRAYETRFINMLKKFDIKEGYVQPSENLLNKISE